MTEIMLPSVSYDVIIVGSGAGGGMAAHNLTQAGAKCLMLEAGQGLQMAGVGLRRTPSWRGQCRAPVQRV
jgi:choline dehydrogenase-like flavoprotein